MYTDTGFTLSRRHLPVAKSDEATKTPKNKTRESGPAYVLPPLAPRSRHDALRTLETAFFAVILGGFALTAGTFAVQLLT